MGNNIWTHDVVQVQLETSAYIYRWAIWTHDDVLETGQIFPPLQKDIPYKCKLLTIIYRLTVRMKIVVIKLFDGIRLKITVLGITCDLEITCLTVRCNNLKD